jgi:hypothetical protein
MLKNKHKFIINGIGRSGKDTVVEIISEKYQTMNISTVDLPKKAAEILGWDGGKEEVDRKFLSDLVEMSYAYNNYPYRYVEKKLRDFEKFLYFQFLFVHSREIKNIERFKNDFGFKTLLVRNPNAPKIEGNIADLDAARDDYEYDYVIDNDGTLEDLKAKVEEFLKVLE